MSGFAVVASPSEDGRQGDGQRVRPNEGQEKRGLASAEFLRVERSIPFSRTANDQSAPPQRQGCQRRYRPDSYYLNKNRLFSGTGPSGIKFIDPFIGKRRPRHSCVVPY